MSGAPPDKPQRVLIVDDYDDAVEVYAEYFQLLGYEVVKAKDGEEAVARARDGRPDVILMDLSLPLIDGFTATRALKDDEATRDIPVVALSGHVMAASAERARQAGCEEFIAKPCLPDEVESKVRALLAKTRTPALTRLGPADDATNEAGRGARSTSKSRTAVED